MHYPHSQLSWQAHSSLSEDFALESLSLKHIRAMALQPLLQCTQNQTLKNQADNYVQKDANSSGLHTGTIYPHVYAWHSP